MNAAEDQKDCKCTDEEFEYLKESFQGYVHIIYLG